MAGFCRPSGAPRARSPCSTAVEGWPRAEGPGGIEGEAEGEAQGEACKDTPSHKGWKAQDFEVEGIHMEGGAEIRETNDNK